MKRKSDLKRKVLCSLLAASTMGIFYSSDALAAKVNGEEVGSTITNEVIFGMENPSGKLVVGQGEVNIQTGADIPTILQKYQEAKDAGKGDLEALRYALAPVEGGQTPIVGVVGGEVKLGEDIKTLLKACADGIMTQDANLQAIADKILKADTAIQNEYNNNNLVTVGSEKIDPVVVGLISGDLAVAAVSDNVELNRTGNINEVVNGGNVILDIGGSAAVTILGNEDGHATTSVNGNIVKEVNGNTNIGIYANGGLAASVIGGNTTSTVNGNTSLTIDTTADGTKVDAMTFGVAGGGAALNINGDSATSNVNGTTYIGVGGNGTAVGIVGGGVAVSYDMSGDDSDKKATATTGKSTVVVDLDGETDSVEMQKALSAIKEGGLSGLTTNLQGLVGQSAAIGVTGGGIALANDNGHNTATATTAGSDIYLVDGYGIGVFGNGIAGATGNAKATANMTDALTINIDKEMEAVGVFGNGLAYFTGSSEGGTKNLTGMAAANATDTTINIAGKVDGVVNGGLAIDDSQSDTTNAVVNTSGTATINVLDGATVNKLDFNGLKPLAGNRPSDGSIDMRSYVDAVEDAAKNIAVAAGGVAVGGGAESTVNKAEVNVVGGTVNGDIIAGGVAGYGYKEDDKGAYVDNSTLNLYGGKVTGNIYAGGSVSTDNTSNDKNYEKANAQVGNATINLAGATVSGVLTGAGVSGTDNDVALNSTLNLIGENTLSLIKGEGEGAQDSSKFDGFTNFNATANSVTKVKGLNDTTALIDAEGTTVTVDGSAKLDINELKADGTSYKVVSTANDGSSFWTDSSLVYDRTAGYAYGEGQADGNYNVTYEQITADNADAATQSFVDAIGGDGEEIRNNIEGLLTDPANTFSGFDKFMEEASTTGNYGDVGKMAMIGEAAGVSSNTISVAGDMADNSVLRLSFTQDDITGEPTVNEDGAVWAKYIHNKHDLDGMASSFGSIDSSSDFDGATIGVDFAKKGKVQSGIAFSYGDGDSHGMGINNDFDMWGVTLYGNVKNDDSNVIADIGFSESDNELTGKAMGKDIKADRDVSVFTVGVRAEKLYTEGSTQIVPYTGLRYYSVDPDSYTAYYDGAKFGEYDADRQNIWTLPVGVSLRNETVTESGWKIVPQANVAYIWAFGDTDNSFDLNTGSGVSTLDYTVMDSGSWLGSLGIEAGKDDWNFGLGYSYQKGSHAEANKWFVNVEYSF